MPENTIEILIRARDEATKTVNQAMGQVQAANQAAVRGNEALVRSSGQAGQAAVSFSRQVSGAAGSARFLGFTVLNELSPALGTGASRIASLATVATLGGSAMAAFATVGIGAAVIALTSFFQSAKKAREEQEALNKAIAEGNIQAIIKERIAALQALAEAEARLDEARKLGADKAALLLVREAEVEAARKRVEKATQDQLGTEREINEEKERSDQETQELAATTRAYELAVSDTTEATAKWRAELLALDDPLHDLKLSIEELELAGAQKAFALAVSQTRQTVADVEKLAEAARDFGTDVAGESIDKMFREIRQRQNTWVAAMTSLGNAGADALFDGLIGRSRSLSETFRSFMEGLARDVFRNTLVQAFGGKGQGLSFQNLLSLGGGGGPLGRVAAVAAGVPGTAGLDVAVRAAGGVEAGLVGAEEAFPGASTVGTGQFAAGLAGVGIGALGLLGASQAQDPLTGTLSGGLGGYALGSGLGTLFQAGSYIPYIGAVFAVAGLAYGLISGGRARTKSRREEARRRRIQAQVELIQDADTLEELEALSGGILLPARTLVGRTIPARLEPLEPEAMQALRQRAGPLIAEFEARRTAGTRSLEGIEALLAQGVSPDVGGVEIQLGRERRRLEILGGLEAIETIGIEEQLAGGIRRRTIIGAGAFGLARARQGEAAGMEIILNRPGVLRAIVQQLVEQPDLLAMLARAIRGDSQARDFRIEDLDALRV